MGELQIIPQGLMLKIVLYAFLIALLLFIPVLLIDYVTGLPGMLIKEWRYSRLKKSGILDTDNMTGIEFEHWLKHRFREMGYSVKMTPTTGDGGADLILHDRHKDEYIAVQAKKLKSSKKNVGVKAIEEALRGKLVHRCDRAIVVTNQYFGKQAQRDAAKCGVDLWDRDYLLEQIELANKLKTKKQSKKIR